MANIINKERIDQIIAFLNSLEIRSERFSEIINTQNISVIQYFNQFIKKNCFSAKDK